MISTRQPSNKSIALLMITHYFLSTILLSLAEVLSTCDKSTLHTLLNLLRIIKMNIAMFTVREKFDIIFKILLQKYLVANGFNTKAKPFIKETPLKLYPRDSLAFLLWTLRKREDLNVAKIHSYILTKNKSETFADNYYYVWLNHIQIS